MTHAQRLSTLAALGWHIDETAGRHKICNESCAWMCGKIGAVDWSAWMSKVSGMVYLHGTAPAAGEYDFTFDAFCQLVRDGWPKPKVAQAARGLFDGEGE